MKLTKYYATSNSTNKIPTSTRICAVIVLSMIIFCASMYIQSVNKEHEEATAKYNLAVEYARQGDWENCTIAITPYVTVSKIVTDAKPFTDKNTVLYLYTQAQMAFARNDYKEANRYLEFIDTVNYTGAFSEKIIEFKTKILPPILDEIKRINAPICPIAGLGDSLETAQKQLNGKISNGMLKQGINHTLASANSNNKIFNINMTFGGNQKLLSWDLMKDYIPEDKVLIDSGYDTTSNLFYCRYTSKLLAEKIPESEGKFVLLQMAYGGDITAAIGHEVN